mmetsp:Transcript_15146/g.38941  ORF Transcript_15146/g.38941 Transcript_15146/m.38941 type:complete len:595 (-) Transcript_15146:83-1867(-)
MGRGWARIPSTLAVLRISAIIRGAAATTTTSAGPTSSTSTQNGDGQWLVIAPSTCDGKEVRYEVCSRRRCNDCTPVDCELTEWSNWSDGDCTGLCQRERDIKTQKNECGKSCAGDFVETKRCPTNCHQAPPMCPENVDCEWGNWSLWSDCTLTCGGGERTRYRDIQTSPKGKGKLCEPGPKSQVAPCRTEPCRANCVDAEWSGWSRWGPCSATCGGGVRWRHRTIAREANKCGRAPDGKDKEYEKCNTQSCSASLDCMFSAWAHWSDCTCECDGVKQRSRDIAKHGKAQGKWCDGPTTEVAPCNLASEILSCKPERDAPLDCQLSDWAEWNSCSASCGTGQTGRSRAILVHSKNGGRPCTGVLSMAMKCEGGKSCPVSDSSKPCIWGDWGEWGACERCGGERKRYRHIEQMPENGGAQCHPEASEEIGRCPRQCHDHYVCEWGAWLQEGDCSVTCDEGTVKHVRYLQAKLTPVKLLADGHHDGQKVPSSVVRNFVRSFGLTGEVEGSDEDGDETPPLLLRLQGATVGFLAGAAGMIALWVAGGSRSRVRAGQAGYTAVGDRADEEEESQELLGPRGLRSSAERWLRSEALTGLE